MKWFKRMITRWVREDWENASTESSSVTTVNTTTGLSKSRRAVVNQSTASSIDGHAGLNITVMSAIGGKIITFRHYDRRTDDTQFHHYVVPEDMDFERELGKMITLESLRG